MFFANLINYCAVYFTFVQTQIRKLNEFMSEEYCFRDAQTMELMVKDIAKHHIKAIE